MKSLIHSFTGSFLLFLLFGCDSSTSSERGQSSESEFPQISSSESTRFGSSSSLNDNSSSSEALEERSSSLSQTSTSSDSLASSSASGCRSFDPSSEFCDDRDGTVYSFVTIGNQIWMAQNLSYLPQVFDPLDTSSSAGRYYVYHFPGTNVAEAKREDSYLTYGALYNQKVAQQVCPPSWHLPTEEDWLTLIEFSGGDTLAGAALKMELAWFDAMGQAGSPNTNRTQFSALPGGYNDGSGTQNIGSFGYWWTSTEDDSLNVEMSKYVTLFFYGPLTQIRRRPDYFGFSVRCIKD